MYMDDSDDYNCKIFTTGQINLHSLKRQPVNV